MTIVTEHQPQRNGMLSNAELAERFGRKVINGLVANESLEFIEYYSRLAGSYARLAIREERRLQLTRELADDMIALGKMVSL